jgi:hypothetical protein
MNGGNRGKEHRKRAAGIACGGILLAGLAAGSHWHRAAESGVGSPLAATLASNASSRPSSVLASDSLAIFPAARPPLAISHPAKRTPARKSSGAELRSAPVLPPTISPVARARAMKTFAALPMTFEANSGQTDPRVKFLSRAPGYTLFLADQEAVLSLSSGSPGSASAKAAQDSQKSPGPRPDKLQAPILTRTVRLKFAGGSMPTAISGRDQLPGKTSYFLGNDPTQWHKNIANYEGVAYRGVYPGVDVVFHGNQQRLEYDFVVAPGADPHAIALDVEGAQHMRVTPRGDVVLSVGQSELELEKPVIYQVVEGQRREVAGNFELRGPHRVSFSLGPYDHTQPLVIDPVLSYSTYLGGTSNDVAYGIAVDSSGNAYITGTTGSTNFPTVNSQPSTPGVFVAKLNPTGSALVYSSFLGGSNGGTAQGIAVDSSGNAYVTGSTTSTNFPTVNPFQATNCASLTRSYNTAFVTKLNSSGSALDYSTYLGGCWQDEAYGIAVDSAGNAYLTGRTASTDFPTLNALTDINKAAVRTPGNFTAFVTELNSAGSALVYSTYLGGSTEDFGYGIAIDSSGDTYVTGQTYSTDFPLAAPLNGTIGAFYNGFVTKLNFNASSSALTLGYSTYLGGTGGAEPQAIAVDSSGNAYVTGNTYNGFPITNAIQGTDKAPSKPTAFVAKLNTNGSALDYATYLGGSAEDLGQGIAVDSSGNAYVTGYTSSNDFPLANAVQDSCGGCSSGYFTVFVAELNAAGSALVYSTYLGGTDTDIGYAIAVDSSGNAYVTGSASSINFPTVNALQGVYGGNEDAFVAKISRVLSVLAILPATIPSGTAGVSYSPVTFTATGGTGTVTISESGNLPSGMVFSNGVLSGTPTQTGSYPITITATDSQHDTGSENLTLVIDCPTIAVSPSALANGMVGTAYPPVTFSETGGVGAITLSQTGLPTGIGMTFAAGVLSGTPTASESFPITVTATDSNQCSGSVTDTLTINSVTFPPAVVSDNETITVSDTETLPDVADAETITVKDGVTVTPLISVTAPVASFSTSSLGFGSVAAGSTGTQIITVSNVGEGQTGLLLSSAAISPSGTPFSVGAITCSNGASSFSTTLPSGGACLVPISYVAPASGTPPSATITITFTDNAALSNLTSTPSGSSYTQTISLNGGGTTAPQPTEPPATVPVSDNETITVTDTETFPDVADSETITVSDQVSVIASSLFPVTLTFTDQLVGSTSATQTVTLFNGGTTKLTVGAISTTADFTHPAKTCTATLAAGSSCTISIAFAPKSTGAITGTLTVGTNGTVGLSGTGIAPSASITPATYAFANRQVDTTSAAQTFTYSNAGSVPITVSTVTLSGAAAANYVIVSNPCTGVTLAPAATCDVDVTFVPSAANNRVATLTVTDETGGAAKATASLSGTGVAASASLTGNPAFGNQQVGVTSAVQTLTYQNTGLGPISVNSAALSGNAASDYVVATDTCTGATLAASATCNVGLTLTPSVVGSRAASLTVTDSTGGAKAQSLSLSGTGAAPTVSLESGTYAYGAVTVATPATFTLTNSGTAPLVISTIALTSSTQFSVTGGTCIVGNTVSDGSSCTVIVTFTPSGTTKFTDTLTVSGMGLGTGAPTYTASRAMTGH